MMYVALLIARQTFAELAGDHEDLVKMVSTVEPRVWLTVKWPCRRLSLSVIFRRAILGTFL